MRKPLSKRGGVGLRIGGLPMFDQALFDRIMARCRAELGPIGTPCMLWQGHRDKWGYGRASVYGKMAFTHRALYTAVHGPIESSVLVLHNCDVPNCCNIKHLRIGTHADNMQDRSKRRRTASGEKQGSAKLTTQQVCEMRLIYETSNVSHKTLASIYGIGTSQVQRILTGQKWAHAISIKDGGTHGR
jgi:hypothetical protein